MTGGAAGAGGAGGGVAAGGDAAQGQGEGAAVQTQGQDVGALAEQLQAMQTGQEELRSLLQGLQAPAAEESTDPGDELDLSFLDNPYADTADIAQKLAEQFGTLTQRQVQELAGPLQQELQDARSEIADLRMERQFDALVNEFPEIGEPEVTRELIGMSSQMAQQFGHPELATSPGFMRLVYMGARAAETANAEGNAPGAATLEGGGGANPGGGQPVDLAEQIVSARRPRGGLPFG